MLNSFINLLTVSASYTLDLLGRSLEFSIQVLVTIFVGLFGAGLLVELGVLQKLSALSRPLISLAYLPEICASSFLVSMGSTVAANGMVARFHEDNIIDDREVFLSAAVNSIPAYIREIFTYQIPVVVPALGLYMGLLYASVFIVTALVKIALIVLLGRAFLKRRSYDMDSFQAREGISLVHAAAKAFRRQIKTFVRISLVYIAATTLIFYLRDRGAFDSMSILPLAEAFRIPSESFIPLTTYVVSPVLGMSMLGPLIRGGSLSEAQAMVVLMLGSMFMLPVFALRSMVPNYTALFGPRLGLSIVAFSTGISVLVRFVFLLAFLRIT